MLRTGILPTEGETEIERERETNGRVNHPREDHPLGGGRARVTAL